MQKDQSTPKYSPIEESMNEKISKTTKSEKNDNLNEK